PGGVQWSFPLPVPVIRLELPLVRACSPARRLGVGVERPVRVARCEPREAMSEAADHSRRRHAGERAEGRSRSPLMRRGVFVAAVLLICFLWAMPVAGLAFALVERGVEHWWLILVFGLLMPVVATVAVQGARIVFRRGDGERGQVALEHEAVSPSAVTRRGAGAAGAVEPDSGSGSPLARLPVELLSRREVEVLEQLAAGLSNREIARALHVAPGTVKAHLNHIFRKLGATSRLQAVAHAREAGLLEVHERE
ncbi:MAG TPA: response regulator transcription factor, partial [Glycomyces sp.]|nr:response regulator transcription factor [Glycomyces sp.]